MNARLAPVCEGFGDGLREPVGEGIKKSGEDLGAGQLLACDLAKGDGGGLQLGGEIGGFLVEIKAEPKEGEGG